MTSNANNIGPKVEARAWTTTVAMEIYLVFALGLEQKGLQI